MDIVSLLFLFLMVALGGVSAFLADWLAWRIGKKRLSVLNMRPKHFARLAVTTAGTLIPLVTILLVAAASRDVREWIVRGNRAVRELPAAVAELDRNRLAVTNLERERRSLQDANEKSRRAINTQSRTLRKQRDEAIRLRRQIAQETTLLGAQARRLSDQARRIAVLAPRVRSLALQARLSASRARSLQARNAEVSASLRGVRGLFRQESARLETVRRDLTLATAELTTARSIYNKTNDRNLELTNRNTVLGNRLADLESQVARLGGEIADLESARRTALESSREAQVERDRLLEQLTRLQSDAAQLDRFVRANSRITRLAALTFRRGDELARLVVPANSSVASARETVRGLLADAARIAGDRGAQSEGGAAVADLAELGSDGRVLAREEQIEYWATRAAGGREPRLLVARTVANFFAGEPVAFGLELFENPVVFASGEVVAEGRVDGRRSDAAVYAQIAEFLSGRVNAAAQTAKMVPRQEGGSPTFGGLDPAAILAALREARGADRALRIEALADGPIRAGDPLRIRLRLR